MFDVKLPLTERDRDILIFIATFGKSYFDVIAKTFYRGGSEQVCRNRLGVLKNKYSLIKNVGTGTTVPRYYIALTEAGKRAVELWGIESKQPHFSLVTMRHNMIEQLTYYVLWKLGENVSRTIVKEWKEKHRHTPDLIIEEDNKLSYIEIELTKKTQNRYKEIFLNSDKDGADRIIYVCEDEKVMQRFKEFMPKFDKLHFITIDGLFESLDNGKLILSAN